MYNKIDRQNTSFISVKCEIVWDKYRRKLDLEVSFDFRKTVLMIYNSRNICDLI